MSDRLQDRIPQPRGFAIKVFNVKGEMFDSTKTSQDIEFNSTPALDLADAKTTKEIIDLRINYGANKPELYKRLEARNDTDLQKFRDSVRNTASSGVNPASGPETSHTGPDQSTLPAAIRLAPGKRSGPRLKAL